MFTTKRKDLLRKLSVLFEFEAQLTQQRLEEVNGEQDFHFDMPEVFEPLTKKQAEQNKQSSTNKEKRFDLLTDQTKEMTDLTKAKFFKTQVVEYSSVILKKRTPKFFFKNQMKTLMKHQNKKKHKHTRSCYFSSNKSLYNKLFSGSYNR